MDDPFISFEDVNEEKNIAWVKEQNARTDSLVSNDEGYKQAVATVAEMLGDPDKQISAGDLSREGQHLLNFFESPDYARGVLRRCHVDQLALPTEERVWETILDVAELNKEHGKSWVLDHPVSGYFRGRILLRLSDGGKDAIIVREFDVENRKFVPNGFNLDVEARSEVEWIDEDSVLVATNFGPGSMTESDYPRQIRRWRRGQPMNEAELLYEGEMSDVEIAGTVHRFDRAEDPLISICRSIDYYHTHYWILEPGKESKLEKLDKRELDQVSFWHDWILITLREKWDQWRAGTVVAGNRRDFISTGKAALTAIFEPTETCFLEEMSLTKTAVVCSLLDNVASWVIELSPSSLKAESSEWRQRKVSTPPLASLTIMSLWDVDAAEPSLLDDAWLCWYQGFLMPSTIVQYSAGSEDEPALIHRRKALFDPTINQLEVRQYFATSSDGVQVPYFVVGPPLDRGPVPCILYGYGGFAVSYTPWYSGVYGKLWLEPGNAYVLANIRGGGEFGPSWHLAAVREKRQVSFDDFCAIASDIVSRGITTSAELCIEGGSNGGALVAACAMQQPQLFGAMLAQCALLDMHRYSKLFCGASWMGEYGNPEVAEDWEFIQKWSPYHNVPSKSDASLPKMLFTTSTADDRVHPGHSRKMVRRLQERGHGDQVYLYENLEGGHQGAADDEQRAIVYAREVCWIRHQVKGKR